MIEKMIEIQNKFYFMNNERLFSLNDYLSEIVPLSPIKLKGYRVPLQNLEIMIRTYKINSFIIIIMSSEIPGQFQGLVINESELDMEKMIESLIPLFA